MIKGAYRLLGGRTLTGWAVDKVRPDSELVVRLYQGNTLLASAQANQLRPNLKSLGIDNTSVGFSFSIADVAEELHGDLRVSAVDSAGVEYEIPRNLKAKNRGASSDMSIQPQSMASPVFIVGSPRSGTSALVNVLSALGFNGFKEGNYLTLLHTVDRMIEHQFNSMRTDLPKVMLSNIDRKALKQAVFSALVAPVTELNPVEPWFDKTGNPGMIRAIPIIADIWPNSVFILAKRRGIENILSRVKKFPQHSFEYHCKDWTENFTAWREISKKIPAARRLEIDQRSMAATPDDAVRALAKLLKLDRQQYKIAEETLRGKRPQQTEPGSSDRVSSLSSCGWTAEQIQIFRANCGDEMKRQGYSEDESYWLKG